MTPQDFLTFISQLESNIKDGMKGYGDLTLLVGRVRSVTDRTDPMAMPVNQAEIDNIMRIETPLYNQIITQITAAAVKFAPGK